MEKELKELVVKIKDHCRIVIEDTKQLQSMVTDQGREITQKEILQSAKSTALSASRLTDIIDTVETIVKTKNDNIILQKELLISSSKDVRNNALKFLKCAKEVFDNPYDYLTSQNLNSAFQEVLNSISNTISTICMLRIIVQKETGRKTLEITIDHKNEKEKDGVIEASKELATSVRQVIEQLKISKAQTTVVELLKKVVINLKNLLKLSSESPFDLEKNCNSLRICAYQLIALVKTYIIEKESIISFTKIENTTTELAREIRAIMMQVQKNTIQKSSELQDSPTSTNGLNSGYRKSSLTEVEEKKLLIQQERLMVKKNRSESLSLDRIQPNSHHRENKLEMKKLSQGINEHSSTMNKHSNDTLLNKDSSESNLSHNSESDSIVPSNDIAPFPKILSQKQKEILNSSSFDLISLFSKHFKDSLSQWNHLSHSSQSEIATEVSGLLEESLKIFNKNEKTKSNNNNNNNNNNNSNSSSSSSKIGNILGKRSDNDLEAKNGLSSLFNADSLDDWHQLLSGTKEVFMGGIGGKQKLLISMDTNSGGISSSLQELYNDLYNKTYQLIIHANHAVLSEKTTEENVSEKVKTLNDCCIKILSQLSQNPLISNNPTFSSLFESSIDTIRNTEISTPANQYIVLDMRGQLAQLVYSSLLKQLYTHSNSLRVISLHTLSTLKRILQNNSSPSELSLLQIASSTSSLSQVVSLLLGVVSTAKSISALKSNTSSSLHSENESNEGNLDNKDFWEEYFLTNSFNNLKVEEGGSAFPGIKMHVAKSNNNSPSKKPLPKKGTLNHLIDGLTSFETLDRKYMSAFIITYRSFTTPSKLLEKLIQRYNAPNKISTQDKEALQLRVGVVIKYWVENQFIDFDDNLVESLTKFIETTLKNQQKDLSNILLHLVQKLDESRKNKITIFQKPPTDLNPPPGQYSPAELFYQMSTDEIARQITIIDWSIFSAIEPSELLNQSWNKLSVQHRAQNVFTLVTRLNKISYWVPSMILWQINSEMRVIMIRKFMEIAIFLYKLNNYNGLMGIIAGLNMSSISRLKKSWLVINEQNPPNSTLSQYRKLEFLMSPTGSWKNYRSSLSNTKYPAIPYLGTYLGDLTFIDEGNPNMIKNEINFEKRELIFNIIDEVKRFQETPFKFPIVEPIYTFLSEPPSFNDKDLYSLSLLREPREITPNTKN